MKSGFINGQGTAIFPDGKKYVGEWKKGKQHGYGVESYPNGEVKTGYWKNKYIGKKKANQLRDRGEKPQVDLATK